MSVRMLMKAAVLLAAFMDVAVLADGTESEIKQPGTADSRSANSAQATEVEAGASRLSPAKTADSKGIVPRDTRVIVITSKESELCRREIERLSKPGGAFEAMRLQGWKIGLTPDNHIQLVDKSEAADLLKQFDSSEFPVVACVSDNEIVRSFKDGCSTPLDAWTFGWLMKGVNERPKEPIPTAIRVATTGHYPLRGNHWSVDGDTNPTKESLVFHLRGANHVSYLNADWKIEEWSTEELRSLHDDLHEKYGPPAASNSAPASKASSFDQFSPNRKAMGKF